MPSYVRVTNLENERSVVVRVNDRGPFARGREIDLSLRAAQVLGFKHQGTAKVRVQYVGPAALAGSDEDWLTTTVRHGGEVANPVLVADAGDTSTPAPTNRPRTIADAIDAASDVPAARSFAPARSSSLVAGYRAEQPPSWQAMFDAAFGHLQPDWSLFDRPATDR